MTKKVETRNDPDQSKRFIEAARELGCDEDESRFNAKLKKVAEHKPMTAETILERYGLGGAILADMAPQKFPGRASFGIRVPIANRPPVIIETKTATEIADVLTATRDKEAAAFFTQAVEAAQKMR